MFIIFFMTTFCQFTKSPGNKLVFVSIKLNFFHHQKAIKRKWRNFFWKTVRKMEDDCSCCVYANFMHARVLLMVFCSPCYNPHVYFENFLNIVKMIINLWHANFLDCMKIFLPFFRTMAHWIMSGDNKSKRGKKKCEYELRPLQEFWIRKLNF